MVSISKRMIMPEARLRDLALVAFVGDQRTHIEPAIKYLVWAH